MKNIFLISILFIALTSCSDNSTIDNPSFDIAPILGKWKYVETLDYNPPGPYLISNGPIIDLKSDGTFTSNEISNYNNGTYTVSLDSIITLNYISNTNTYTKLKRINVFSENELVLDNDYLSSGACTEGCAERYAKVSGE